MSSKLRIQIGDVEIDYEGTEEFLKQELPALLRTAMELHKAVGAPGRGRSGGSDTDEKGNHGVPSLTTGTIAARLKSKSGPSLLLSAAAHLTFVANKETFSRQGLLAEMQNATSYYKKSYSNNLTKYIASAVTDGKLQESATNAYALSANTRSELETQLADS
jgi:hypothetical protein